MLWFYYLYILILRVVGFFVCLYIHVVCHKYCIVILYHNFGIINCLAYFIQKDGMELVKKSQPELVRLVYLFSYKPLLLGHIIKTPSWLSFTAICHAYLLLFSWAQGIWSRWSQKPHSPLDFIFTPASFIDTFFSTLTLLERQNWILSIWTTHLSLFISRKFVWEQNTSS